MAYNKFKVKLRSQVNNTVVAFDVSPDVSETRNVEYKTMQPVHMPGGIHVYGYTNSRTFSVNNIKLVSRTAEEAARNLYRLNVMRSWAMPYFGRNNTDLVGAPPDVLAFTAYARGSIDSSRFSYVDEENNVFGNNQPNDRSNARTRATNLQNIPVVLTQISNSYPSDIDYIPTANAVFNTVEIEAGVPFPTIMTVDIQLLETHSPREYERFSLDDFRRGRLDNF